MMIPGLSTSTSGLVFSQNRLHASAHNTVNLNTKDAAKAKVRGGEISQEGVRARYSVSDGEIAFVEEAVEQILSGYHFTANLRTVETQDQMLGALLDVRA